jgi:nitronate monooxygenase
MGLRGKIQRHAGALTALERLMFLQTRFPIIQAPMAVAQGSALAIAVCEAGGLGSLPCALLSLDQARAEMRAIRAGTSAPFNVNFFCHVSPEADETAQVAWRALLAPYYAELGLDIEEPVNAPLRMPFDENFCALVEEIMPEVVSFHFGLPSDALMQRVRATGAKILGCATTVAEALWLEKRGVDAIIAQGAEAGGHRGVFLDLDIAAQPGLFALLPQVVSAVGLPVIAAGGIADGRGIAACFALGASAVQIGTAYLLTPQAKTSPVHREALKAARDDATRLTNLFTGRPARGLFNRLIRDLGPVNAAAPAFPLAASAIGPLRAVAESQGKGDFSSLWSGEAASLAQEIDAGELTRQLWRDALKVAGGIESALQAAQSN